MDDGLWVPRDILRRYPWEQGLLGAAIWEAYQKHHAGKGKHILVPTHEILTNLSLAITPANVVDLRDIAYAMYAHQKIAHRIDERHTEIWIPEDVLPRTRHYQRMPRAA